MTTNLVSVTTVGQGGPTKSEAEKDRILLETLQGRRKIFENPWTQLIIGGASEVQWPLGTFPTDTPTSPLSAFEQITRSLNDSQLLAVNHMLARTEDKCVTVIQGECAFILWKILNNPILELKGRLELAKHQS